MHWHFVLKTLPHFGSIDVMSERRPFFVQLHLFWFIIQFIITYFVRALSLSLSCNMGHLSLNRKNFNQLHLIGFPYQCIEVFLDWNGIFLFKMFFFSLKRIFLFETELSSQQAHIHKWHVMESFKYIFRVVAAIRAHQWYVSRCYEHLIRSIHQSFALCNILFLH